MELQSSTVTHLQPSQTLTAEPAKCRAVTRRTQAFSAASNEIAPQACSSSWELPRSYSDSQRKSSTPTWLMRPGQE